MKRVITKAFYRTAVRGQPADLGVFVFEPEMVEIAEYEYWSVPCTVEVDGENVLAFNTVGVSTLQALSTTLWSLVQRIEEQLGVAEFDWEAGSSEQRDDQPKPPRSVNGAVPVGEAYVAASNGGWSGEDVVQFSIQIFAPSVIHEGVQITVITPGLKGEAQVEATNGVAALIEAFRHVHRDVLERFDGDWKFRLGDDTPVDFEAFQAIYFGDEHSPLRSREPRRGMSSS